MERLSLPENDISCGISFLHQMSVGETYHVHTHDFYEIFYVVRGGAMHHINGENECCMSGTMELIRPSDVHEYRFINQYDMELISIGIVPQIMEEVFTFLELDLSALQKPMAIRYDVRRSEKVLASLMKLEKIKDGKKRRQYGKSLLAQLLYDLMNKEPVENRIPDWLNDLLLRMCEEENYVAGLKRMVELSCVTQSYLNREMKKYIGLTPTEFINAKRIGKAGDLLLENHRSITEIAESCGFETLSNFYENFKKNFDCSPKDFVKRNTKSQYRGIFGKFT